MEIGSEFWLENQHFRNKTKYRELNRKNQILVMSGRTAIDYALDLIQKQRKIDTVYFPSYCCQSMLQPFLERNMKIDFYSVQFKEGKFIYDIDGNKKCDLFFAMNYFGFTANNMDCYINNFKRKNIIVIEDSTHSLLSTRKYNQNSDFVVASLRKWFPIISGGVLINPSEKINLNIEQNWKENQKYNELKEEAMKKKYLYINSNKNVNKTDFLQKFAEANEVLEQDYKNYKIDKMSEKILTELEIKKIIDTRKENAGIIYNYLKKIQDIGYVENIDLENDCPIFVPIFFKNKEKRENLKNVLIKKQIYCPNHWPIPNIIQDNAEKAIYDKELSLICDQRYSKNEIEEYLKNI